MTSMQHPARMDASPADADVLGSIRRMLAQGPPDMPHRGPACALVRDNEGGINEMLRQRIAGTRRDQPDRGENLSPVVAEPSPAADAVGVRQAPARVAEGEDALQAIVEAARQSFAARNEPPLRLNLDQRVNAAAGDALAAGDAPDIAGATAGQEGVAHDAAGLQELLTLRAWIADEDQVEDGSTQAAMPVETVERAASAPETGEGGAHFGPRGDEGLSAGAESLLRFLVRDLVEAEMRGQLDGRLGRELRTLIRQEVQQALHHGVNSNPADD